MRINVDHLIERLWYFIFGTCIAAWALMLVVGIFHGATGTPERTLGFLQAFPAVILLRLVGITFTLSYD